jgi:hypothetical protein
LSCQRDRVADGKSVQGHPGRLCLLFTRWLVAAPASRPNTRSPSEPLPVHFPRFLLTNGMSCRVSTVFTSRRRPAQDHLRHNKPTKHHSTRQVHISYLSGTRTRHGVSENRIDPPLRSLQHELLPARRHPPAIWMSCTCIRAQRAPLQAS